MRVLIDYLYGAFVGAGIVCYVGFGLFGSVVFWKGVSGGEAWGFVGAMATISALIAGPIAVLLGRTR